MLTGVRWLKSRDWVDGGRVGVWGWSGGGTSTLLLMTRSEEFKAGIAIAPVTDWRIYDTKFTETYMKTPADNPDGYENFDLVQVQATSTGGCCSSTAPTTTTSTPRTPGRWSTP